MIRALVFDWGNTVMRDFPEYPGPMALWPHVEAIPGIAEALAQLRPRYRLALATNAASSGADLVGQALARVGLEDYFTIFAARDLGTCKPEPAFFARVLDGLGCAPQEAAMVGDDYRVDIVGAKAAGLRAIWFNPSAAPCPLLHPQHDAEVRTMAQLPAAVADLHLPDLAECLALLAEQEVPPRMLKHSQAVAAIAYALAIALRQRGVPVDPLLAHRGGLLHDLDKVTSRRLNRAHGQLAAELLRAKGQPELAQIAQRHVISTPLDPAGQPTSWEEKLVFYVDKIVEDASVVSVAERLRALAERYPEYGERMRICAPFILELEAEICTALGTSPAALQATAREHLAAGVE